MSQSCLICHVEVRMHYMLATNISIFLHVFIASWGTLLPSGICIAYICRMRSVA